jgi:hypothetical protein
LPTVLGKFVEIRRKALHASPLQRHDMLPRVMRPAGRRSDEMNIGSIGVTTIAPTTATPAQAQPALEKTEDAPGVTLPLVEQNDDKTPPPPGLGRIVDKTV